MPPRSNVNSAVRPGSAGLDRRSPVPLYYQLQEVLKQRIEAGDWGPGDALPPELELARLYDVSRVCVRQALAILEDDREIVRVQGRGTFVATRKLAFRPTGISGLPVGRQSGGVAVRVIDCRTNAVERAIANALAAEPEAVLRLTTLWSLNETPFALGHSFFRLADVEPLARRARAGRDLVIREPLGRVGDEEPDLSVEVTQCGQFEADLLGIPNRSPLLLTFLSLRHRHARAARRPEQDLGAQPETGEGRGGGRR
ncbi:MAG TPA: GntR family transcriptional regulator, partial [Conexibacter sp.]|nr:GntR family transcriptional regulator [Conexibacter sp.]